MEKLTFMDCSRCGRITLVQLPEEGVLEGVICQSCIGLPVPSVAKVKEGHIAEVVQLFPRKADG